MLAEFLIREEEAEDSAAVLELVRTAFGRSSEAALIERLRSHGDILIAVVALHRSGIVGQCTFSKVAFETHREVRLAAALAPVCVAAGYRGQGLGSQLIQRGLEECRSRGAVAAVVLGHRDYYPRLGFSAAAARELRSPYSGSDAYMAMELVDGGLAEGERQLVYPRAFSELG